jgi:DNA-binding CsgD family transcriptional regulator
LTSVDPNPTRSRDGLFGRDDQLELVRGLLGRAAVDGDALIVVGQPGVGKSALLRAAEAMAAGPGGRVLSAAGVESEADVTFSGLHEALFPLYDEIAELTDSYREALAVALGFGDGPPPDRLRVANATLTLLATAASSAPPLLLTLDDLQWLDRSSAVVLSMVARRLRGTRVAMLCASRSGDESFFERSGLSTVELGPLDDEAAGALINARFPGLAPAVRARLLDESEGNPLAVLELPAALSDRERTGMGALPAVLPLSRRLQGLFRSRVASLPDRSRWLLLLVALDPTGDTRVFEPDDDSGSALDDLAPAEEAGLAFIDSAARRVMFRHPMIRSAVVELSTVVDRRKAHKRLAELWADQPDRQVWHLAEATVYADERVAVMLEQASERVLRRGDGVGAVTTLIRAADLSPKPSDRARRMALAAYIGADVTGQLQDASQLLADAHEMDPELGGSLQAAATAALLLLTGEGDVETAHQVLAGAIASRGPGDDEPGVVSEALNALLMVCHFGGRPELWEPFDQELAKLDTEAPAILRLSGQLLADPARKAAPVLVELDDVVGRLATEMDPIHVVRTAIASFYVDRLGACREALGRLVRESSESATATLAINALCLLGYDSFLSGEWDIAAREAERAAELCRVWGFHLIGAWPARYIQALLAAGRGDYETVRSIRDEMVQWAVPRGVKSVQWYAWHAETLAALGQGDFEGAYRRASAISPPGTFASHVYFALLVPMDLVEAAVHSDRREEAAAHVKAMRDLNIASLSSRLALLVAGSAAMASPVENGVDHFEEALALHDSDRWPFERARVELAYGERLRRARAMTEARSHLTAALDAFDRLGARPWSERAANELRATGQTRVRGVAGSRGALTPQEFEIATLAATGLSNKEIAQRMFLSPRTVAAHLYRAFPKLGVSSRAGLRDALDSLPAELIPKSRS